MKKRILIIIMCFKFIQINAQFNCDNWLKTTQYPSRVSLGDLDIEGEQITVKANFNSLGKSSNGSWGHIVSKHTADININYAISPNGVEIGTEKGYFFALDYCDIKLNKNYHIALTYDGKFLKFYRNGYLMKSTKCSGKLITNDLNTIIGNTSSYGGNAEQFNGYINEVRVWNVCRSQQEIKQYVSRQLPNPPKLKGLKAYYTFDNLKNKQGNTKFDAVALKNIKFGVKNSKCEFIEDSCGIIIKTPSVKPNIDFNYKIVNCNTLKPQIIVKENTTKLNWFLDDKLIGDEQLDAFTPIPLGKHNITLKAWNNELTTVVQKEFNITTSSSSFNYNIDSNSNIVTLTNTSSNISNSIRWFIDNVFHNNQKEISFTFNNRNSVNAKLVTINQYGCTDTTSKIIDKPKSPTPKFESSWLYVSNSSMGLDELFAGKMKLLLNREKVLVETLTVTSDTLIFTVQDNATIDGDRIAIFLNKQLITADITLTDKPKVVKLILGRNKINELEMVALNLGTIPPNTASITVHEGQKKTTLTIESSETKTGVLRFLIK